MNFYIFRRNGSLLPGNYDIYVGPYTPNQTNNLIESVPTNFGHCLPEGLRVENWNIDPTTDIYDRSGPGIFNYSINERTRFDYPGKDSMTYLDATKSKNGILELTGDMKVLADGNDQTIRIFKTSTPWEGTLRVLAYRVKNPNASRSGLWRLSGSLNNFSIEAIGSTNGSNASGAPISILPVNGTQNYNSSVDLKFKGTDTVTYKVVFAFEGVTK